MTILSREADLHNPADLPDRLAWVNDSPDNELDTWPGPNWDDPDGYTPTPEEDAEVLGWELGLEGEPEPFRCDDFSISTEALFGARRGWSRGRHEREERAWREEREAIEYEAWLDELARDRVEEIEAELAERYAGGYWHESEVIRAVGSVESRRAYP